MTQDQLKLLAKEYAELNHPQVQDEVLKQNGINLNASMVFEPFLRWLTKTHCIVDKKRLKEMYACYLQNEQVAKRLGLEYSKDIAHGSTATMRDIFGVEFFINQKGE